MALCLVSCGSYIHTEVCVFHMYLPQLSSMRYFLVRGTVGGDDHVSLRAYVAVWG